MGFIRAAFITSLVGAVGTSSFAAYLAAKNPVITPLSPTDPIWSSKVFKRYNPNRNPTQQDICIKRIPLSKVRPELLEKPGALATEYCRGVWTSLGFEVQRRYLEYKYSSPETAHNLWSKEQLSTSNYEKGTCIADHFEVVERTNDAITLRCGDSPRNSGLRGFDGLFVVSAKVDKEHDEVELGLKSALFTSEGKIEGKKPNTPPLIEELHQWYARIWSEGGSRRLLK
ncbi:hypothetical protein GMORB2_7590 [Geosmithia morbida]|uniref:Uncharacterized protein n=1 Tax=Geosmithia morbida TaxID=1094350 RepID=A0A9P5D0T8_9HYPO|nr:uncharacterized protein GMORB2_7590 [Geosmithia morbida]KAF4121997.1 hypothetical protein GMORB2_7590 [Geosmithia morbida]